MLSIWSCPKFSCLVKGLYRKVFKLWRKGIQVGFVNPLPDIGNLVLLVNAFDDEISMGESNTIVSA